MENDKNKGRILVLASTFPRWAGDAATPFIPNLCHDLQDLGWKVDVLVPHAAGSKRVETMNGLDVRRFRYFHPEAAQTVCYEGGGLLNLRSQPFNLVKLPALVGAQCAAVTRAALSGRYDLFHAHWILPQGFAAAAANLARKIPTVVTVHGGDIFGLQAPVLKGFKRFALRSASHVTVNSSATESAVKDLCPDLGRISRFPIGITTDRPADGALVRDIRQQYRREEGPLLGFLGRVIEEKGIFDFIEAIDMLRTVLPGATGLVIGDGPALAAARDLARDKGLLERIHFKGWVDAGEVPSYMQAFDIFVGPSKRSPEGWVEAQGLTFLEAMLAGTPVIGTRSGGIPDTVRDGETGFLVEEGAVNEIAEAILRIHRPSWMGETADFDLMARKAYELASREYSRAASARRFSALFDDIIGANRLRCENLATSMRSHTDLFDTGN